MRVSERLVVQQVDQQLVFVDDSNGAEAVVLLHDAGTLAQALNDAHLQAQDTYRLCATNGSDMVPIHQDEYNAVSYALGYFTGVNRR